jgi:putative ATPase
MKQERNADQGDLFGGQPGLPAGVAALTQSALDAGAAGCPSGTWQPLATRMRPRSLAEIVGQPHIIGPDCLLPRLVATNTFGSIVLYGPPGCGKTSLAEAIARQTGSRLLRVNAVLSNVAELREMLRLARQRPELRTVLFIDEIHRFNKAQQDLLLPDVEAGAVRLIGATTHNPGFYINPPLLSRSHLFKLEPVSEAAITGILQLAISDCERGLGAHRVAAAPTVLGLLARMCDGDLRRALNALETLVLSLPVGGVLDEPHLQAFARERHIRYDATEDEHYDTASAFIKSMRGCDPDAALYWLAKMLKGGEDPRFIARRLIIFASEDIGLADPRALPLAVAAHHACEIVGLPECRLNLAHAVVFLATCPKSNSTTVAIGAAIQSIEHQGLQSVPPWLRDAHTVTNRQMGQGAGYLYSHDFDEAISGQQYMSDPQVFYLPKTAGAEAAVGERLARWRALRQQRSV